ncbi:MAG: glycosyltransferase [Bacteroidales bacterium]
MFVVNIVDRVDMVNFGIWNAAVATAPVLKAKYGVISQLWYPAQSAQPPAMLSNMLEIIPISSSRRLPFLPPGAIVVTHGCWRLPTRLGTALKKKGFPWMYVPHGMLEPWSMSQKWYLKYPYYWWYERPNSLRADIVRAVSLPEKENLEAVYPRVIHIPNGNYPPEVMRTKDWMALPLTFLFLGRLHKKKGLVPLVQAWKSSTLYNNPAFRLIIAGPDDGLLSWLKDQLTDAMNVSYVGPIFGDEKNKLLQQSHFFVLPSYSEGFPTSVVEAMQYGLIPLISSGCNFPEVFGQGLAIGVEPDVKQIKEALEQVGNIADKAQLSEKCRRFAVQHYSIERIADLQYQCYRELLTGQ